jgi:hypothetical protein
MQFFYTVIEGLGVGGPEHPKPSDLVGSEGC